MAGNKDLLLVRRIAQLDRFTLGIEWTDGHASRWRLAHLRRHCPCAHCRDEWTGERKLRPEDVPDELLAHEVRSVGRYALTVRFADGHDTGLYPFPMLRQLCQCDECSKKTE